MTWAPLAGLVVLELAQLTPGCYATRPLVEMGARVIKVEQPGGDPIRQLIPGAHEWLNRGKESIVVDPKEAAGRALFRELVQRADLVVENFRERTAQSLGVTSTVIRETNLA